MKSTKTTPPKENNNKKKTRESREKKIESQAKSQPRKKENKKIERANGYLSKVQGLSLKKRKLIFWLILSGIAFILIILFIFMTAKRINGLRTDDFKNQINLPSFDFKKLNEK